MKKKVANGFLIVCLIIVIAVTIQDTHAQSPYVVDPNTTALWRFDEGSGFTVFDAAGNYDINVGGSGSGTGIFGPALSFSGGEHVEIPHDQALTLAGTDFTIEAWINWDGTGGADNTIIAKRGGNSGYEFYIENAQNLAFQVIGSTFINGGGSPLRSTSNISPGTNTHVAVVHDSSIGQVMLYVNGILEDSKNTIGAVSTETTPVTIGKRSTGHFFNGIIDEVRLSNVARTVAQFCMGSQCSPDSNTIALWHFNEGTGSIALDSSGNGHNGNIVGASYTGPSTSGTWSQPGAFPGSVFAYHLNGMITEVLITPFQPAYGSSEPLTWEAWIKTTGQAPFQDSMTVMGFREPGSNTELHMDIATNGFLVVEARDSNGANPIISGSTPIGDGQWHHVAFSRNGWNELKIYVDGLQDALAYSGLAGTIGNQQVMLTLGALNNDGNFEKYFMGDIDEVRLSNVARHSSQFNIFPYHFCDAAGNVNAGVGQRTSVLSINGDNGGSDHRVQVNVNQPFTLTVDAPPTSVMSWFVLYLYNGEPSPSTLAVQPGEIGRMCFPTPLNGAPVLGGNPLTLFNTYGLQATLGVPFITLPYNAFPPLSFAVSGGLPIPMNITLQGIITDPGAPSTQAPVVAVTNAVVLEVI